MELSGKKTLVLGAGKSGVAGAKFLRERGATVALHDRKPIAEWNNEAKRLKEQNIGLLEGNLPSWLLDQIELVVISPGVPTNTIPARYVDRKDGEVIGEIELAYRFLKGRIVGITGSNGKTTTTSLIFEILKNAGIEAQIGGNIGTPLISLTETATEQSWTVVELSSFQLETIRKFRPNVAVALNVTPNHLDRYELFTDYAAAKHRLFMNQTAEDVAILNADDEITASWAASGLRANVVLFSTEKELEEGLFLRGRDLVCRANEQEKVLTTRDEMSLRGLHNASNVLAALAAGLACGAAPDSMRETIKNFKAVEHRLEFVSEIGGVKFYNDSKATSVDATQKALEALADDDGKIVLILGGLGKNAPYAPLADLIQKKARKLVLIGEDAPNIESQLKDFAETVNAESMQDAVEKGFHSAERGDSVLLAPACASFDMFGSYEERGVTFKNCVFELGSKFQVQSHK
ncbi:MAG TPA: UDP-N-acetylmuramoyl-L-alanine--D-glutamate ligase [Pyrinomonadaceae bacterium]|nr:UDP-N-acetylmuramoyl-L-alanine--D-glutamate ligase [Pyrinomonadaceae bacterium]